MSRARDDAVLEVSLREYEKLKDEQTARIGFRDNLIYVTLAVSGALYSFALTSESDRFALLVLPPAVFVLGWTYLMNDDRISAIATYIRTQLRPRVLDAAQDETSTALGWETSSKFEAGRLRRKIVQVIANEILFVGSGSAALITFQSELRQVSASVTAIGVAEIVLMVFLGLCILLYGDVVELS